MNRFALAPLPRRRTLILLLGILVVSLLTPRPLDLPGGEAEAQFAVFDAANFHQNILTALRTAQAVLQRVEMIRHQIEQIRLQVLSLKELREPFVRQVLGLLSAIERELERTSEALVFTLPRRKLEERFRSLYPDGRAAEDLAVSELAQVRTGLATARAALQATRQLAESFPGSHRQLALMKDQLLDAEGILEASQAAGLLTSWVGEEVSLLNEQTAVTNNLLALALAHWLASSETAAATLHQAVEKSHRGVPPYAAVQPLPVVPSGYPRGLILGGA